MRHPRPNVLAMVVAVAALLALLPAAAAAQPSGSAGAPPPAAGVDPAVLDAMSTNGVTDFWVRFSAEADLSAAEGIADWAARGQYVYDTLQRTAASSQATVVEGLAARDVTFDPSFIVNAVRVQGGTQADLDWVRSQPGVSEIVAPVTYAIPEPIEEPATRAPHAIEWGILNINADDVWNQFGIRGEGIVVANIDTGVQYDHPALVNQYRGNLGGSGFDHNYNWFNASNSGGVCVTAPCDVNGHGTHTMGTMVGDDRGANQIGVAPGARWITANGCATCSDADLIESGEWMLAPTDMSGNNPRPDLRPNIINNSWGSTVPSNDPFMEDVIVAWEAAGIFGQWSNGNSGPACSTSGSPGSRIVTYSSGAYDINNSIASFSGRGPGQNSEIKPNIAAPGSNVRSSRPGSTYGNLSGTSMASPHVAGTIALMWSAAPTLIGDIDATRQLLDDTAIDVDNTTCGGTADDNNVFGEGRLNALTAVEQSPRGPSGTVTGTITDEATGAPIAGATVTVDVGGQVRTTVTGANGTYAFASLPVGSYDITAGAFGYATETVEDVPVTEGTATVVDFALAPVPAGAVSGRVIDDAGNPVAGAVVTIVGTPIPPTVTDQDGVFEFPSVPAGSYTITVRAGGCLADWSDQIEVPIDAPLEITLDRRHDAFGHICVSGPSTYIEAGTPTGLTGDDASVEVPLPSEFPFYGEFHDSVFVATNGFMNFASPLATLLNTAIPTAAAPNNAVYPFWDDLFVDASAQVLTADLGDRFVIEWRNIRAFGTTAPRWDFEAVLYLETGEILFQYRGLAEPREQGSSATVGIENTAGTDALQYSFNQPVLSDAVAIRFIPPAGGAVRGTVIDANDGLPLAGVTVTATATDGSGRVITTVTDADGHYGLAFPEGVYDITFAKANYVTETRTGVAVDTGDEITIDVAMRTGVAEVAPDSIEALLLAGWTRTYPVTLTNTGSADLQWDAYVVGGGRLDTPDVPAVTAERDPDADPDAATSQGVFAGRASPAAEPQADGDVIISWPTGLTAPWGVGYTGNVWLSDIPTADTNTEFTPIGARTGRQYVGSFGGTWPGDMAYDAARGWMCQVNVGGDNGIHCWDPNTGTVVDSLTGDPWDNVSQRGLAYNPDDDTFYIGGWNEGVVYHVAGFSHATPGATLSQCEPDEPAISGLAYNGAAGVLFMVSNSTSDTIYQLDPDTCATIGTLAFPDAQGFSGAGAELAEDGNLWVTNQDTDRAYLIDSGVPLEADRWLEVQPDHGVLPPGQSQRLDVTIDTTGLAPGVYTAAVVLVTDAGRQPTVTIPIELVVTDYLQGVNAGGGAYTDRSGDPWAADQAFDGAWGWEFNSRSRRTTALIAGTLDDPLYQDARTGEVFTYRFDNLPDGVYEVELHFAEIQGKAPLQRIFDVTADSEWLLVGYDVADDVGQNTASVLTFPVEVDDGSVRIRFLERFRYGQPIINALQLTRRPDLSG